jgi:hypothetical protein
VLLRRAVQRADAVWQRWIPEERGHWAASGTRFTFTSSALSLEEISALADGDAARRAGVDAALALEPSLLYDFSVPASDDVWPNQGAAGARYDMGAANVERAEDFREPEYVDDKSESHEPGGCGCAGGGGEPADDGATFHSEFF